MASIHRLRKINLLDQPAEALIYSSNVHLQCSGGVGAALVDRYGPAVQTGLHELLTSSGRRSCEQGEIFEWLPPEMPYKTVLHTVPTDFWHDTTIPVVEDVLRRALRRCVELGHTRLAFSALATGYGDLMLRDFLILADRVFGEPALAPLAEATLCLPDGADFAVARKIAASEGLHWQVD
ncbi:MAG: macro domain-containing protein [Chthoniobacteraceae bacterium]